VARTPAALIIDQDVQTRFELRQVVRASGLTIAGESGFGVEAVTVADQTHPDVFVIGVKEPMERALQTMESLDSLMPETPVVVYSDHGDIEIARKVMLVGARDILVRPVKPETLRDSVIKAMEAEENRRLRKTGQLPAAATQGTIITVFGAKGGIGKSTVATNLAVALAKQQQSSVVIIDLDNGFGDVAGMLDAKPDRNLLDLIRDIEKVDLADLNRYLAKHEYTGLDVLAGPPILDWRKISPDEVRQVIDLLAKHYDKIVLDTSGTLNEISELAVEMATMVLWVTTTEFASVKDTIEAMRALQLLSYSHERVRVVMNAISSDDGIRPSVVQDALQRDVFWQIPYDKKVRQGTHLGQPIVITTPQSVAARSFTDLATVISGGRVPRGTKMIGGFKWRPTQQAPAEGS
jgi:pilus assembly protein CpaE